jgi:hypothetical protein
MRLSIVFVLLFTCAINAQETQRAKNKTQVEQPQASSVPEPAVQQIPSQKPDAQTKQPDPYDPRNDCLYRLYLVFTIVGVCVALGGVYAIYKQTKATAQAAKATARSAEAAERSVTLQEIAQKQWVNLEEWQVDHYNKEVVGHDLEISFQIANHTKVPLTLHAALMTIDAGERKDVGQVTLIAPGNPFVTSDGIVMNAEQKSLWNRQALGFKIEVTVLFSDSHGIHWQQDFGRMLFCEAPLPQHPNRAVLIITDTKNTLRESGVPGERGSREVEDAQ